MEGVRQVRKVIATKGHPEHQIAPSSDTVMYPTTRTSINERLTSCGRTKHNNYLQLNFVVTTPRAVPMNPPPTIEAPKTFKTHTHTSTTSEAGPSLPRPTEMTAARDMETALVKGGNNKNP
eukprot:3601125-Amphidinium_carterae.1